MAVYEGTRRPGDFTVLRAVLAQQTLEHSTDANGALLQTFYDLLSRLIGEHLAERLLRSLWENPSNGRAVLEASP